KHSPRSRVASRALECRDDPHLRLIERGIELLGVLAPGPGEVVAASAASADLLGGIADQLARLQALLLGVGSEAGDQRHRAPAAPRPPAPRTIAPPPPRADFTCWEMSWSCLGSASSKRATTTFPPPKSSASAIRLATRSPIPAAPAFFASCSRLDSRSAARST